MPGSSPNVAVERAEHGAQAGFPAAERGRARMARVRDWYRDVPVAHPRSSTARREFPTTLVLKCEETHVERYARSLATSLFPPLFGHCAAGAARTAKLTLARSARAEDMDVRSNAKKGVEHADGVIEYSQHEG